MYHGTWSNVWYFTLSSLKIAPPSLVELKDGGAIQWVYSVLADRKRPFLKKETGSFFIN